jgi:hypothetical protein
MKLNRTFEKAAETEAEIEGLLRAALDVNFMMLTNAAKTHFFAGWRSLVELALVKNSTHFSPADRTKVGRPPAVVEVALLAHARRSLLQVITELLIELLHKTEADDVVPDIAGQSSELVSVLMANLRLVLVEGRSPGGAAEDSRRTAPLLLAKGKLLAILRGLVNAIVRSGQCFFVAWLKDTARLIFVGVSDAAGGPQQLAARENNYASLLYYLQVWHDVVFIFILAC